MARNKSRKGGIRRRATRRRSAMGRIMKPVDVRKKEHFKGLDERIRNGPLTLVFVYADWCGHCKTFAPYYDNAANNKGRSIQAVKVNENMLGDVNSHLKSVMPHADEIQVNGYPSLILVDSNGKKVSEIEPVREESVMKEVMNKSGSLSKEMGNVNESLGESISVNTGNNQSIEKMKKVMSTRVKSTNKSIFNSPLPDADADMSSFTSPVEETSVVEIRPPTGEEDIINVGEGEGSLRVGGSRKRKNGGSLYGSLAEAAYTLAPAGIIFGLADHAIKREKRKTRKGGYKKKAKKSMRRRH
jgi:thiol-disulfide isomerase/thioredoxin